MKLNETKYWVELRGEGEGDGDGDGEGDVGLGRYYNFLHEIKFL